MAIMLKFANPSNFSVCYRGYVDDRLTKQVGDQFSKQTSIGYRAIIEQAPFPIAVLDDKLCFLMASEKFIKGHQLDFNNYIGKCLYDIWPESKGLYQEKLEKCLCGEIDRSEGDWVEKKNGSSCWTRWDIRPWYKLGNIVGGLQIYSDVVTLDKTKEDSRENKVSALSNLHKLARIGTWERDLVKRTKTWSSVLKEILEVPEDFEPSLDDTLVYYKDEVTREMIAKLREDVKVNLTSFDVEVDMVTAKGNYIRVRFMGYPYIVNGKCEKICGIIQDITNYYKKN
jgi:PAS domain S-box-containing protein